MMEHSILPPSSAARRMACPGSRIMEEKYPELEESQYAREGTAAHWVAQNLIEDEESVKTGTITPNGEIVTHEMINDCMLYVDDFKKIAINTFFFSAIEYRVNIPLHPLSWGTVDAFAYSEKENKLYVWDFKYGHGYIDVFENWQLISYVAGLLQETNIKRVLNNPRVIMRIVQPRCYTHGNKIREWSIAAADLTPYFYLLAISENSAMGLDAPCIPNAECNYCSARHACTALQRSSLTAIDVSKSNVPHNLSGHELGNELRIISQAYGRLKARKTGLEEQALMRISKGEKIAHYTVAPKSARQYWKCTTDKIKIWAELMGLKLFKEPEPLTPKQAMDAGLPKDLVKNNSEVKYGAKQLVLEDEKEARKAFN